MGNKGSKRKKGAPGTEPPPPTSENTFVADGKSSSDGEVLRVGTEGDFFERARKEYMDELQESSDYPNNLPVLKLAEIMPFLYLGDIEDAADISKLQGIGITHIVNCCGVNKEMIASGINDQTGPLYYHGSGINYMQIEAEDRDGYDMTQHFIETSDYIEEGRKAGGKVFVHCVAGASRSPTIVASYLLIKQGWDLNRIARHVIRQRHLACPRAYFAKQLEQYDAQLKKERSGSGSGSNISSSSTSGSTSGSSGSNSSSPSRLSSSGVK